MEIEDFLDLTKEEIDTRKKNLREIIPTFPGIRYLQARLKKFEVQPWPFISYLAHYAPDKLKEELECYKDYDGSENSNAITEQLKEKYIMFQLLSDLKKENPDID